MSEKSTPMRGVTRRQVLTSGAAAAVLTASGRASAVTIDGTPQWRPFDHNAADAVDPSEDWQFFTAEEAATVEAITERLIPADELSISGREAGCAVFIDRQLAGFFGTSERLYMQGPFAHGTPEQGDQSALTPRERYRVGLAALDDYCATRHQARFAELAGDAQDEILSGLERGEIPLEGIEAQEFFSLIHQNTMEGFFADPVYGGNRDMVSWRMLGFPGARYDYRDYVEKHNQKLDFEPLSIAGRSGWRTQG